MNETIIGVIIAFIVYMSTLIGGLFWIGKKIDDRVDERIRLSNELDTKIDERIMLNPIIKGYELNNYILKELEKDVLIVKTTVQRIELKIAKLNGEN